MGRVAALLFVLFLAACLPFRSTSSPTEGLETVFTAAAVTMEARLTLEAGQTQAVQQTSSASQATQRAAPPPKITPTQPAPTDTAPPPPIVTATESPAAPTPPPATAPTQAPCNQAEWLGDVSVPADTLVPAGSTFTKIWRVGNSGSCSWSPSYALVFTGGNLPPLVTTVYMPDTIQPGQVVDLSVTMTAPATSGVFQNTWMLRDPSGQMFGVGPSGLDPLVARVRTFQLTVGANYVFDLTAYYCAGSWRSGTGQLTCPGLAQDPNGSVLSLQFPTIETRQTNQYGLWVRPNQAANGWISGTMPAYLVQSGDYFLTEIGCLQGYPGCDVIFEVSYQIVNGASGQLGRWREFYDGVTTLIEIDLSTLMGRSIYLVLTVYNNGSPSEANGVWLQPRIQQSYQRFSPALAWTRHGYFSRNSCDELRVSYVSQNIAVAEAFDCRQGSVSLGQITLTADQFNQLSAWVQRLENSEGEFYSATQDRPVTTSVFLGGVGQRVATNEELQAMANFAAQLYDLIVR
jgi:hypothetical protein